MEKKENIDRELFVIDPKHQLVGEGTLWDDRKGILYTLDIRGKTIRAWEEKTGVITETVYPQQIGCIALTEDGRILSAMTDGIYIANPDGSLTPVCVPEKIKGRRFNDGKVGPDGRFYVGTTDASHEGAFYRLDPDGTFTELFGHVGVSNGLCWTGDGRTMYYCDSPDGCLDAFDFDMTSGTYSNRRTVLTLEKGMGMFDGMTIDDADTLWAASWEGACVYHIDPKAGAIIGKISLPVSLVSCCGFAGGNMDILAITSASRDISLEAEPLAGCTFGIRTGAAGVKTFRFKTDIR